MAKTEQIQIRVTPELKAAIQAAAEEENRTISNFIITVVKEAIEKKCG